MRATSELYAITQSGGCKPASRVLEVEKNSSLVEINSPNLVWADREKLLESPIHEVRAGAVSIMDWQARRKKTPEARRKELFELYLRRHDRINNWDLVDRSAPYVVGGYLFDKPRDVLYQLARSKNIWECRTAMVSTGYFIRQGEVADTF